MFRAAKPAAGSAPAKGCANADKKRSRPSLACVFCLHLRAFYRSAARGRLGRPEHLRGALQRDAVLEDRDGTKALLLSAHLLAACNRKHPGVQRFGGLIQRQNTVGH